MQYLKTFAFSIGKRYQDLVPLVDLVTPNRTHDLLSFEGWAYCARTPDKNIFLLYFEKGCPRPQVRGARLNGVYSAQWFNPRNGTWMNVGSGKIPSSNVGIIKPPDLPGDADWGLKLIYEGPDEKMLLMKSVAEQAQQKKSLNKMIYISMGVVGVIIVLLVSYLIVRQRKQ